MSLSVGTQLGSYEITGELGAGGMGEVYRATDARLGRDVAIKTLPAALSAEEDRLARFEREAKLVAGLNHSHIASVYSLDEHDGTLYLAMELVEGETLENRLKSGALPVEDALNLAVQIAEALEAAHERGVVHRDLKPANVMITTDGVVKVLDFGLAKAFSEEPGESNLAQSPALSVAMTQQGLVLGTAGYMSPEQASGQPADQRADIWAFGVVLYEMLTGMPLFSGESVTHVLADVLKTEPDWSRLPENLHPRLKLMLQRCLTKKPKNRYHSIADVRVDIQQVLSDPEAALPQVVDQRIGVTESLRSWRLAVLLGAAVVVGAVGALTGISLLTTPVSEPINRHVYVDPQERGLRNTALQVITISPDGRQFVYNSVTGFYLRRMDELEPRLISGSEGSLWSPTFSPDGRDLVYWSIVGRRLNRISTTGGAPVPVADLANAPRGMSWGSDGSILFGQEDGIWRVREDGGTPERIIEALAGEFIFGPTLLPDGDTVLFSSAPDSNWDAGRIFVESLSTGERKLIIEGGSHAKYLASGHIVYAVGSALFAAPFDLDRMERTGGAVSVVEGVTRSSANSAVAQYDVSVNGTLVYLYGTGTSSRSLVRVDRQGNEEAIGTESQNFVWARLSPDETEAVLEINDGRSIDIWKSVLARGTLEPITSDSAADRTPLWMPDGEHVVFWSNRDGGNGLYTRAADGRGAIEHLIELEGTANVRLYGWTPDQRYILFEYTAPDTAWDLGLVDLNEDPPVWRELLAESRNQGSPTVSPDGEWFAYNSEENGDWQIWIERFPDGGQRQQISIDGGVYPIWSTNSRELFYRDWTGNGALMRAELSSDASDPELESITALFPGQQYPNGNDGRQWDVAADGQHFLMIRTGESGADAGALRGDRFIIVENWFTELERRIPSD